jgi:hypothetical protein
VLESKYHQNEEEGALRDQDASRSMMAGSDKKKVHGNRDLNESKATSRLRLMRKGTYHRKYLLPPYRSLLENRLDRVDATLLEIDLNREPVVEEPSTCDVALQTDTIPEVAVEREDDFELDLSKFVGSTDPKVPFVYSVRYHNSLELESLIPSLAQRVKESRVSNAALQGRSDREKMSVHSNADTERHEAAVEDSAQEDQLHGLMQWRDHVQQFLDRNRS